MRHTESTLIVNHKLDCVYNWILQQSLPDRENRRSSPSHQQKLSWSLVLTVSLMESLFSNSSMSSRSPTVESWFTRITCQLCASSGTTNPLQRTLHIDVKYFFLRDRLLRKQLKLVHTPTEQMITMC